MTLLTLFDKFSISKLQNTAHRCLLLSLVIVHRAAKLRAEIQPHIRFETEMIHRTPWSYPFQDFESARASAIGWETVHKVLGTDAKIVFQCQDYAEKLPKSKDRSTFVNAEIRLKENAKIDIAGLLLEGKEKSAALQSNLNQRVLTPIIQQGCVMMESYLNLRKGFQLLDNQKREKWRDEIFYDQVFELGQIIRRYIGCVDLFFQEWIIDQKEGERVSMRELNEQMPNDQQLRIHWVGTDLHPSISKDIIKLEAEYDRLQQVKKAA